MSARRWKREGKYHRFGTRKVGGSVFQPGEATQACFSYAWRYGVDTRTMQHRTLAYAKRAVERWLARHTKGGRP